MNTRYVWIGLYGVFLLGFAGCAAMKDSVTQLPHPFQDPTSREPTSILAIWNPASRVVEGVPERGFAGKVFFINGKTEQGVKIDGDLIVFAYDEYPGRSVNDVAADKQYPYLAEDLKKLCSKHSKNIGYSYNLWVPWDREGVEGEEKTISLLVKYVPKKGSAIRSEMAKGYLPGKKSEALFVGSERYDFHGPASQAYHDPGRGANRFEDRLPEGYRDWIGGDASRFGNEWRSRPDEREITSAMQNGRMLTTTIPLDRSRRTPTDPQPGGATETQIAQAGRFPGDRYGRLPDTRQWNRNEIPDFRSTGDLPPDAYDRGAFGGEGYSHASGFSGNRNRY